jgi:hypothetical protein
MSKNKIESIVELLPEGLTENTVEKIATLVDNHLNEQLEKKINDLNSRVMGFLNLHMDMIQESAIRQLETKNSDFNRARMMDAVLEMVAVEVSDSDEERAVTKLVTENKEADAENEALVNELNKALTHNEQLEKRLNALTNKIEKEAKEKSVLEENFRVLQEERKEPFHSSERAFVQDEEGKVGANGPDRPKTIKKKHSNTLLSESIMDLMPNTGKK